MQKTSQAVLGFLAAPALLKRASAADERPNILFAIADDQSWPHCSAYGSPFVNTPGFDRVARQGVLFNNTFCAAPQCSPNRASILTGRPIWQNEEAGTHASYFPKKLTVYPDLLEEAGYWVGYTGKPWGPGNWKDAGRPRNPAGPSFDNHKLKPPAEGISNKDYSANFEDFMKQRPAGKPFCFWYGATEPHRSYQKGIGLKSGKKLEDAVVPPFLPDTPEIRSDILDYAFECEWFDRHLNRMIDYLEKAGELENTLIVVTSDNGMPFPRAKATLYEYGIHMPLAICWPKGVRAGRKVDDLISFIDFAPTLLEAAGVEAPECMTGRSFLNVLKSDQSGIVDKSRTCVFSGRERHSHARFDNWSYPSRSIRTKQYLYIRNIKPERWPAGDPPNFHDVDGCPSKSFLIDNQEKYPEYFEAAYGKRPLEELFDITQDPACLNNLAGDPKHAEIKAKLWSELERTLTGQNDPRMSGSEIFDSYPRFNAMRPELGGFAEQGKYNPNYQ
ncbi:MAG: sulfatase [Candidatus Omnitrophica bacterium]|nr:sulfatase [Candidatus Omnitrophota bacterium]